MKIQNLQSNRIIHVGAQAHVYIRVVVPGRPSITNISFKCKQEHVGA